MAKTIRELVLTYFDNHPNEDLPHATVVDWVTEQYQQEHGQPPRDPWRTIRQLHQEGKLIKVKKGVYRIFRYKVPMIYQGDVVAAHRLKF